MPFLGQPDRRAGKNFGIPEGFDGGHAAGQDGSVDKVILPSEIVWEKWINLGETDKPSPLRIPRARGQPYMRTGKNFGIPEGFDGGYAAGQDGSVDKVRARPENLNPEP